MTSHEIARKCHLACEKLAKWRTVFCGWQLGTRVIGDPEGDAVRDHREATMLMRAELSALIGLLVKKGIVPLEEFQQALADEAEQLSKNYEKKFPGMKATPIGIQFDQRAAETMKNWRP